MINIAQEELVSIRDVPKRLPPRPGGRHIHISAVYRWIQRGVRGVRLETVRIGGTSYTSIEAIQRFSEQSTAGRDAGQTISQLTATRRRQIEQAEKQVRQILGLDSPQRQRQGKDESYPSSPAKGSP